MHKRLKFGDTHGLKLKYKTINIFVSIRLKKQKEELVPLDMSHGGLEGPTLVLHEICNDDRRRSRDASATVRKDHVTARLGVGEKADGLRQEELKLLITGVLHRQREVMLDAVLANRRGIQWRRALDSRRQNRLDARLFQPDDIAGVRLGADPEPRENIGGTLSAAPNGHFADARRRGRSDGYATTDGNGTAPMGRPTVRRCPHLGRARPHAERREFRLKLLKRF